MNKVIGSVGSFLAFSCSLPQVVMAFQNGNVDGLSPAMLYMWFAAMVLLFTYIFRTSKDKILMAQYGLVSIQVAILLYFLNFPVS